MWLKMRRSLRRWYSPGPFPEFLILCCIATKKSSQLSADTAAIGDQLILDKVGEFSYADKPRLQLRRGSAYLLYSLTFLKTRPILFRFSVLYLELFDQYMKSNKVKEVYFTGMFTSYQSELGIQYVDPESHRVRHYYSDFIAKMDDNSYEIIEVKGDNKLEDSVVKAKAEAAEEIATESSMKYKMYAGSKINKSDVLAEHKKVTYELNPELGLLNVATSEPEYGEKKK